MVKSELIAAMTEKEPTWTPKEVEYAVNAIINIMGQAMSRGDRIEFRGFGSFSVRYRKPRNAHNPKTGDRVMTVAKYRPHFKAGKALRQRVDHNRAIPLKSVTPMNVSESQDMLEAEEA